jgi:hypothetical protein
MYKGIGTLFCHLMLYKMRKYKTRRAHTKKHSKVSRRGRVRGGSLLSWIKEKALPWVKKNKLLSRGLSMFGPYGKIAGTAAGALGWGKRSKGSGVASDIIKKHATLANLKKYNTIARNKRYISRGLFKIGKKGSIFHKMGKAAHALGYGKSCKGGALGYGS